MDKVIYTVITGTYDSLIEPEVITPGWDYYCFTSNPDLKSEHWEIIPFDGPDTGVLLSRRPKIRFFEYLKPEHNIGMYIDANLQIKGDLNAFLAKALPNGAAMCALQHPGWNCVFHEAEAIKRLGKADPAVIDRQMARYENEGFPRNNGQIAANLLIYRNHNKHLQKHCDHWWNEFSNPDNAQRDQLCFNYVLWKYKLVEVATTSYEALADKEFGYMPHG